MQQKTRSLPAFRAAVLGLACMLCGVSAPALAAPNQRDRPAQAAGRVAELTRQLAGKDPTQVNAAVDALAERGAVDVLVAFFAEGQPDAVADHVLAALGRTRSAQGFTLLEQSTHHRRPAARLAAYSALALQQDPRVPELLGQGLRDSQAAVRGLCARLLGERRALGQLELLFRALARGVPAAGAAIGTMAPSADVARFSTHLQRLPMQVLLDGYEQFLLRENVREHDKLDIVARLGEVASLAAKRFLQRMLAARDWPKPLKHALAETAARIDERPRPKPERSAR